MRACGKAIVVDALVRFRNHEAEFVSASFTARGTAKRTSMASFDQALDKHKDVTRHEPKV